MEIATNFEVIKLGCGLTHNHSSNILMLGYNNYHKSDEGNQSQAAAT